jgi:hypothetical protein
MQRGSVAAGYLERFRLSVREGSYHCGASLVIASDDSVASQFRISVPKRGNNASQQRQSAAQLFR